MFLLVGLGNAGKEYQNTKHNFGFLLADQIIQDYTLVDQGKKFDSQLFSGLIDNQKVILIKPQNFMNLSGGSLLKVVSFYNLPLASIIVFHDDLDLPLGKVKIKLGGGDAGHNGVKDINRVVGKDYLRIRLGIGRPENPAYEIADYVLSKFSSEELKNVANINIKVAQLLPLILQRKYDDFANQLHNSRISNSVIKSKLVNTKFNDQAV